MEKTLDDYFRDWEAYVFGYGYGTGEPAILPHVVQFFQLCNGGPTVRSYNHLELERSMAHPAIVWLLINIFCHADIIEYGTSPRYGWLTGKGVRLKEYLQGKSVEDLLKVCEKTEGYYPCTPDYCNCGPNGYEAGRVCKNPFWDKHK